MAFFSPETGFATHRRCAVRQCVFFCLERLTVAPLQESHELFACSCVHAPERLQLKSIADQAGSQASPRQCTNYKTRTHEE